MDEGPEQPQPAGRRRSGWRVGVPPVLAMAGLLFAITATTAHGTDLRSAENTRLVDLIRAAQLRNERAGAAGALETVR